MIGSGKGGDDDADLSCGRYHFSFEGEDKKDGAFLKEEDNKVVSVNVRSSLRLYKVLCSEVGRTLPSQLSKINVAAYKSFARKRVSVELRTSNLFTNKFFPQDRRGLLNRLVS